MAQKKEELPVNADVDLQNGGTITYAPEVISTIAGVAANEIEGIAGMCISGGLSDIIGRNRNITRGVKVEIGSEEASFDLYLIVEYGQPIQKVCHDVQENVRKAIESMTGLHVARVDVHVQGVSFEKEKQQQELGIEASRNPALTDGSASGRKEPSGKTEDAPKAGKARKKKASREEKKAAEAPQAGEQTAQEPKEDLPDAAAEVQTPPQAASADAQGDTQEASVSPEAEDGEMENAWTAGPNAGGFRETAVEDGSRDA